MAQLGYSSLTLTDLTDTLSVNILLDSSLDQDFQRKLDTKYEPDFTKIGEELIITPTLLLGNEKIDIPVSSEKRTGYIYYQIGDFDSNGNEINYYYGGQAENSTVYVDRQGKLHYKKNLSKNLKIKAYIDNFIIKDNDVLVDRVDTLVPIEIIFFEGPSEIYGYITSQDGREWFEESMRDDITLEVKLYSGEEISNSSNYNYKWEIAAGDIQELVDTDKVTINNHLIDIKRSAINSMQVFICTVTGKSLTTPIILTKEIRDLSDKYDCDFISDKPLIFSPDVQELNITARLWEKKNQINQSATSSRFKYTWYLYLKNSSDAIVIKSNSSEKTLKLRSNDHYIPKDDFTLYCEILIDNKYLAIEKDIIRYSSFSVTPYLSSKSYTFPANENGTYQGTETKIRKTFVFQLLEAGTNKTISYDEETSVMPALQIPENSTDQTTLKIYQRESEDNTRRWNFNLELSLDMTATNDLWANNVTSKTYEFTYTFLDETFSEKIEIIKNVQGKTGDTGQSGYNVQLTNDFHLFAGGEIAAKPDSTSFDISVYYGDKLLKITQIKLNNIALGNGNSNTNGIISGIKISRVDTTKDNGTISTITLEVPKSNDKKLTQGGSLGISVTANEKTFYKTFNYGVNYNGDSYSLLFDVNQISYFPSSNSFSNLTINISPQRKEGGTPPQSYTSGKVFWSFTGKDNTWTQISSHSGGIYKKTFEASQLLQQKNIYFKLEDSAGEILDKETIPILESMEGAEIGGENLIRWSQNFNHNGTNEWTINSSVVTIEKDDDNISQAIFSRINLTGDRSNAGISSPPFYQGQNSFANKTFTFSCFISFDSSTFEEGDRDLKQDAIQFRLDGIKLSDDGKETEGYYFFQFYKIGSEFQQTAEVISCSLTEEANIQDSGNRTWYKLVSIFKLEEKFSSSSKYSISEYDYFIVNFWLRRNGIFSITKPKLEIGTLPTGWSPSSYDNYNNYLTLSGQIEGVQSTLNQYMTTQQISFGQNATLSIITGFDSDNLQWGPGSDSFSSATIITPGGEEYTFLTLDSFQEYIQNQINASYENSVTYSSELTTSTFGTYASAIDIAAATPEQEGHITLRTSIWDTNSKIPSYSDALKITSNSINFYIGESTKPVAYLSNEKIFIPKGQVTEELLFGSVDNTSENGHIKFINADNGIAIIWE